MRAGAELWQDCGTRRRDYAAHGVIDRLEALDSGFEALRAELRKTRRVMLLGFAALAATWVAQWLQS